MRKQLYFTRLYTRSVEGVIPNSVVAFMKRGHEQKVYVHHYTMDFAEEGTRKTYISKYEYNLAIDLWLVKIRLSWLGREQRQPQ